MNWKGPAAENGVQREDKKDKKYKKAFK